jgi:PAS domain S-box-containing protein
MERVQTEVMYEETLQRYRSLIEATTDALALLDLEGKIVDMNTALESLTGASRRELIGSDFFPYFTDAPGIHAMYEEILAKHQVENFPLTLQPKKGRVTDILFNGSTYRDASGKIAGIIVIARNVTEQKNFERELMEARSTAEKEKQVAEEAMKAKQQFLSNMSHEIRTPLNAIIGFTKVVLKTDLNEKQKEYLNAIKISGDALIVLINDILDLAKVDSGKMTFEQIPFKLSDSIFSMLHLFETKLFKKKISLIKEYDRNIPEVLIGDAVRLHQIILNLVGNAVKFTQQGKITVSVKMVDERDDQVKIEFAVADTGIGIAESELDKIFDNFHQASGQTARVYGGTGLGLAIVKQLVLSQGGSLRVESRQGVGSTFTFTLDFKKTNETIKKESEPRLSIEDGGDAKILIVEDVLLNQLLIKTLLKEFGYSYETATNGKLAIDKLQKSNYDLILMDLQMPEMNGYETTEYIRKEMKLDLPIIALTADVTTADVEKCRAVGMNDYLAKPIDDKLLYNKIGKFIKKPVTSGSQLKTQADEIISGPKSINLDYIKQHTNGNPELTREMIRIYLEEIPKLIVTMKESINNMDWESLGEAAHSLIPTFSIMGINKEYEEMAKKIKDHAQKKEQAVQINDLLGKIEDVCIRAIKELEEEINAL